MRTANPFFQVVAQWFKRNFSDPEAIALVFTIAIAILLIELFSRFLVPVLISIVIAYLLTSVVHLLKRWRLPHWAAVFIVYCLFLGLFIFAIFGLLPLMWKQLVSLLYELPQSFVKGQVWLNDFLHHYPKLVSYDPLQHMSLFLKAESARIGQFLLSFSLSTIPSLIEAVLYVVLVPILVFFFLKDGAVIAAWFNRYLPRRRGLIQVVWQEMNKKIKIGTKTTYNTA